MLPSNSIIGVQGGRGSFNEEVLLSYLARNKIPVPEIRYLHTTDNVFRALMAKEVTHGQFAIHNILGGLVEESLAAVAKHQFAVLDHYTLDVSHCLMMRLDAEECALQTVLTHPQPLAQCAKTLKKRYPQLRLESGEGERIDQAKVAELLAKGELPPTISTLGSKRLAEVFGLKIIATDLQDASPNVTTFLLITTEV